MEYELHFQEGFTGETVTVAVDGSVVARFQASTRMQTGLAHIERLHLLPGQEVTVHAGDEPGGATIAVDESHPFVVINREEDRLVVGATERSPGYL
ncbi:MAG: hypothetical protein R3F55_07065 [Alphaproteobacteria bacterium]